jgi:hypothetical protein
MTPSSLPATVVQRQLDAYNARDLDGWLATYSPDAEQFVLYGERLAAGHAQIRARMADRFAEPDFHAELVSRTVMGKHVIDEEIVSRTFPEGAGTVELLCIYEVVDGLIQRAAFAFGTQRIVSPRTEDAD